MRAAFLRKIPWLSLILLLLTFSLLGWYLSAYHSIWSFWPYVGIMVLAVAIIWFGDDLLHWLGTGAQQGWLVASGLTIVACLAVLVSGLFADIVMLLAAALLARIQMRSAGFSRNHTLWVLIVVAALGLGLGWISGTMLFPSAETS